MQRLYFLPALCLALLLSGCINLSPGYTPPAPLQTVPQEYKEEKGWKTAAPFDALDRGPWWELFEDPDLNRLMEQLNVANQDIAKAAANLRQARSQVMAARAAFFPMVSMPFSYTRSGGGSGGGGSSVNGMDVSGTRSARSIGISAEWEVSFWNALPAFEAAKAEASATAADYATIRLSSQAELAQNYFQLRTLDVRIDLYDATLETYRKALQITQSQFRGGIVTRADVAQAEAQLAQAEAQRLDLLRQRAQMEHAIATLTGRIPSTFGLERGALSARLPAVPVGLPSALLERRPDVAAAERRVASANQQIGVARAAWFPTLSLGGSRTAEAAGWLAAPVTVWSLGPSAALSLFEGGKRLADTESAWAGYEASVADYRQIVLQSFQDVEDNLAALGYLEQQAKAQRRAVESSRVALRLAMAQYQGGMTTYLQVVTAQTTTLTNESDAVQVSGQRLIAAVNLIKALGGGWQGLEQ